MCHWSVIEILALLGIFHGWKSMKTVGKSSLIEGVANVGLIYWRRKRKRTRRKKRRKMRKKGGEGRGRERSCSSITKKECRAFLIGVVCLFEVWFNWLVGWLVGLRLLKSESAHPATSDVFHSWYFRNEQSFWAKLQEDKSPTLTATKRTKKVIPTKGSWSTPEVCSPTSWYPTQSSLSTVALLQPCYGWVQCDLTVIISFSLALSTFWYLNPLLSYDLCANFPSSSFPILSPHSSQKSHQEEQTPSPGGSWDKYANSKLILLVLTQFPRVN